MSVYNQPVAWDEAIRSHKLKALIPTTLSHEELSVVPGWLRSRSFMMAGVSKAEVVDEFAQDLENIMTPGALNGEIDMGAARLRLEEMQKALGFSTGGTGMQDTASAQRMNLVMDTNLKMAQGFARYSRDQDPDVLDEWPAQELYRAGQRKEPRDWLARWQEAGGQLYDGRMIARVDDPIWTKISAFDLPYPPFDFNSGMDLEPIGRAEAEELGVVTAQDVIKPDVRNFNDDFQASMDLKTAGLEKALLDSMGDGYAIKDGVLTTA